MGSLLVSLVPDEVPDEIQEMGVELTGLGLEVLLGLHHVLLGAWRMGRPIVQRWLSPDTAPLGGAPRYQCAHVIAQWRVASRCGCEPALFGQHTPGKCNLMWSKATFARAPFVRPGGGFIV